MARLQILELPEAVGDDRPPFVLVIDQVTEDEAEQFTNSANAMDGFGVKAGARAVAVFHGMTMDLPANETRPLSEDDAPEPTGTAQLVDAHERTRLELCDALLLSLDTTWRKLVEQTAERQRELAGLYRQLNKVDNLPERPDVMDANHPDPSGYLHGYGVGIRAAKRAAQAPTATDGG